MSNTSLTSDDVAKLLQDPSPENRAGAAEKVGTQFAQGELSDSERAIAEDIFKAMVKDAEVRVRKALSETLKDNPDVPHEVATSLAKDVADVAIPMIESSSVLTDEDLREIVKTKGAEHQVAIAGRDEVSADVADMLVDTGNEQVVATLVGNDGADIKESTLERVLDEFGDSELVNAPMAQRTKLPIAVAERLVTLVTENLQQHIMTHHELSTETATDLLMSSREQATVSLLETGSDAMDVLKLVDQLKKHGRLTPTLVIRAICMGDMTFFEAALAKLAGIPVCNAYVLVHDKGEMGLERLFGAADMPEHFVRVARAALSVAGEMNITSGDDREQFRQVMIERVLTFVEDDFDTENLDYLIGKLDKVERHAA